MTTIATNPTYPVPDRDTEITITLTESSNFVRVWCTAAPDGSPLRDQLDKARAARLQVYANNGGSGFLWKQRFNQGGVYSFVAQEYSVNPGVGGKFEGDPTGSGDETKAGTEATLTIYVGQRFVQRMGTAQDGAELVLWLWNDSIRATRADTHGEDSPAIINPTSDRARTAAISTDVVAAVTALTDSTVTGVIGDPATISSDFLTVWNAHLADVTVHAATDSDNTLPVGLASAGNPAGLQTFVGESLRRQRRHYTNDTSTGADTGGYHDVSGLKHDWTNYPVVDAADPAYAALAEQWRSYEAHRVTTSVHSATDTTNTLTALPALLEAHRLFFAVLATAAPDTPPTQASGASVIVNYGFEEKNQ